MKRKPSIYINRCKKLSISMPYGVCDKIDEIVKEQQYGTRSEFIREAIRMHLLRYGGIKPNEQRTANGNGINRLGDT